MDFPNDAANDVGSPPPAMVNGVEERPILDEMIARMQREQDERAAAGSSSGHHRNVDRRDQATATGDITLVGFPHFISFPNFSHFWRFNYFSHFLLG